jgi:hypothetical protein
VVRRPHTKAITSLAITMAVVDAVETVVAVEGEAEAVAEAGSRMRVRLLQDPA